MKTKPMIKNIFGASVISMALCSSAAFAMLQSPQTNAPGTMYNKGFYLGAQGGYANLHYKKSWLSNGTSITSISSVDSKGAAGRLFAGYNFVPYLAFEIGYVVLPKVKFNNIIINNNSSTPVTESFRQSIFDAVFKGTLPLAHGFDLYGKAGYASVYRDDLEARSGGVTVKSRATDRKNVPVGGVGASYHLTKNIITDVSYMHYFRNGDLEATDFGGLGLIYQFA